MPEIHEYMITVVDDKASYRRFAQSVLRKAGATVTAVNHSQFRRCNALAQHNHLIVLGFEEIGERESHIIEMTAHLNVPTLVLVPNMETRTVSQVFSMGAYDAESKPFDEPSLVQIISETIHSLAVA